MAKAGFVSDLTRQSEDFPGWYNDVVLKAELADYSPVRGCMIIRPYGFAIWESMRDELDRHIKRTGHDNVYFPLFVPKSLLEREAEHVEGFNPQVAWVTHAGGEELDEPLAIRPTSEAIIAEAVKDWIQSYRDLPLLDEPVEQRRPLGDAHAALPAHRRVPVAGGAHLPRHRGGGGRRGRHRPRGLSGGVGGMAGHPRHPGPQDSGRDVPRRGLHARHRGHDARQARRSRPAPATCSARTSPRPPTSSSSTATTSARHPYGTSWGFSTRMVGATIMAHGDDSGLVLPPNVAPTQVVVVPIFRSEDDRARWPRRSSGCETALADVPTASGPLRFKVDWREESPGYKYNHWELRGVPFRLEIGPRDVAAGQGMLVRRLDRAKEPVPLESLAGGAAEAPGRLPGRALPARARLPRREHPHRRHATTSSRRSWRARAASSWRRGAAAAECEKQVSADTERDHPRHPVRLARRSRRVRRRRRRQRAARPLRARLLSRTPIRPRAPADMAIPVAASVRGCGRTPPYRIDLTRAAACARRPAGVSRRASACANRRRIDARAQQQPDRDAALDREHRQDGQVDAGARVAASRCWWSRPGRS